MKWINRMVERITRKDAVLNNCFNVNRHRVVCQSGMTDYVCVLIDNAEGFSFDFWTKQLSFEHGCKYRFEIMTAFSKVYGGGTIKCNGL